MRSLPTLLLCLLAWPASAERIEPGEARLAAVVELATGEKSGI